MSGIASSSISLAGSEEQINFSQQSPKMLKMASESFFSCFVVVFRSFSQNFLFGAPDGGFAFTSVCRKRHS